MRARHGASAGAAASVQAATPREVNSEKRRSSKDAHTAAARHEEGTLVASGFIAGGALVGVLAALLRFAEDVSGRPFLPDLTALPGIGVWVAAWSNWNGLAVFLLLGCGVYWYSRRAAP